AAMVTPNVAAKSNARLLRPKLWAMRVSVNANLDFMKIHLAKNAAKIISMTRTQHQFGTGRLVCRRPLWRLMLGHKTARVARVETATRNLHPQHTANHTHRI